MEDHVKSAKFEEAADDKDMNLEEKEQTYDEHSTKQTEIEIQSQSVYTANLQTEREEITRIEP